MAKRYIKIERIPVEPTEQLTKDEIEEICCDRDTPVDPCSEVGRVTDWYGYMPGDLDIEIGPQKENWTGNVVYEAVGPDGPCGKVIETWEGRNDCCDEIPPIVWDYESSADVLDQGKNILLFVTGGHAPYTWKTSSNGTFFQGGRKTIQTSVPWVRLYAGATFCGKTLVSVADGCTSASSIIRSADGQWLKRDEGYPKDACHLTSGSVLSVYADTTDASNLAHIDIAEGDQRQYSEFRYDFFADGGIVFEPDRDKVCATLAARRAEVVGSRGICLDDLFPYQQILDGTPCGDDHRVFTVPSGSVGEHYRGGYQNEHWSIYYEWYC